MKTLRTDLAAIWLAATTSLIVGLLLNQFRSDSLPLVYRNKAERLQVAVQRIQPTETLMDKSHPATLPQILTLEEFSSLVNEKGAMILDTRPKIFYGLGHVPGALNLPRDDFENAYTAIKKQLDSDRTQPIVIYCGGPPCESSMLVRDALSSMGFTNLAIFEGGWNAWTSAKKIEATLP